MASLRRPVRSKLASYAGATGLTAALVAAACTGQLGELSKSDAERADPSQDEPVDPTTGEPLEVRPLVVSRLNRLEYNNTVRDLLGSQLRPADGFPADGLAGGFDTVGVALSLSPTYVIAYERAAHELIDELFANPESSHFAKIVLCDVEEGDAETGLDCARSILKEFTRRAWRRPVTDEEVDSVLHPFQVASEVGATRTDGLRHSLAAVLMSPFFLFKLEIDPDPSSTEPRDLSPYELATRLSYALWATTPDDELLEAAESGNLTSDEGLAAQIDRMLDDPRSDALLESFAARWLDFKRIDTHEVNPSIFPEYDEPLARSMRRETEFFIREFLHDDRPVAEMLTAGFTYVDERLAAHYGLSLPTDSPEGFSRIDTAGTERIGLLTLGSLLTTTSFSSRTSPVRRGEFVFSHLLCGSVPPPPPGVEGLPAEDVSGLSLRERLEQHRSDPSCSGCHSLMDPLGFGFENYDAIGRYRTLDGTAPINAAGELDGVPFTGAEELSLILSDDPRLAACVMEKFLTYAGRRPLSAQGDQGWVAYLTDLAEKADGGSLRSIIRTVLSSDPFRRRVPSGS